MDTSKYPKSDASFLLLNEIEILLTQIHLTELYVKQAQSAAANEAARIQNQHETELSALKLALAEKAQLLASRQQIAGETEKKLLERAQNLEQQANETQRRFDEREALLEHARAEVAALRERIARLRAAKEEAEAKVQTGIRERQELQSAFAALRQELEVNQRDFEHQQLVSRALQENLQAQLDQLRVQLAEREAWAGSVVALQQARSEIAEWRQRSTELQASRQEIEAAAVQAVTQARARFETELSNLQTALDERDRELRETQSAMGAIEQSLRAESATLRAQLRQAQEEIQSRAAELRNAQEQLIALQQRITEIETAYREAAASALDTGRARASLESEIATLRREVALRERALTERQEAVSAGELALHGKIQALQQELARGRSAMAARTAEVRDARAEAEQARRELENTREQALGARRELDARLQAKEEDLRTAEAGAEAVKSHFEANLSALQIQLAERHLLADGRAAEIENLNAKIGRLSEQAAAGQSAAEELSARVHAESEAAHQAEIAALRQEHREFQRRLEEQNAGLMGHIQEQQAQWTAVQSEQQVRQEYAERIKELKAEVQAQAEALHQRETAFSQLEQTLRAEIERLIDEAQEKHLLLQNRNDELVRSKSERDALQGKNRDLAATSARIEAAMSAEAERMRTEFQAQLAFLQAELSQKEWALEEKHAAGGGKDQQYREQIELLSRQLAEAEPRKQPEKPGIGDDALTEEQEERYAKLREVADAVTPRPDPSFPALENRRWRTQMGWKRRWK
jgi:chromosome segregation ATPase